MVFLDTVIFRYLLDIQLDILSRLPDILVRSLGASPGLGLSIWGGRGPELRWRLNLVYSPCEQVGGLVEVLLRLLDFLSETGSKTIFCE